MEEPKKKPQVAIIDGGGRGMSSVANALLCAALASSMRETPIIDTLKAHRDPPEDFVIFERNPLLETRLEDLFGPLAEEITFAKKPVFETAEEAYWRRMQEEAERGKIIASAAEKNESPWETPYAWIFAMDVEPMPRRGVLTTLRAATSSLGLTTTLR